MKKIIIAVLILTMLVGAIMPASAADVTLKSYDEAVDGELLYTFNFNGDNVWAPKGIGSGHENYTWTPSADGSAITIKWAKDSPDKVAAWWGALIKSYAAGKDTVYSIVYKQKANTLGEDVTNMYNRVGVGAWFENKMTATIYNAYTNYTAGSKNVGIALHIGTKKQDDYVAWGGDLGEIDETDGYQTIMVEYNGPAKAFYAYVLKKGGDIKNAADWIKLHQAALNINAIDDCMGLAFYCQYAGVDTEIKNVQLYKNTPYATGETTAAPTTEAPTAAPTTAAPTAAPETEAPTTTEAPAAEGGCGATVGFAGMALIATVGACTVVVSKKKRR